MLELKELLFYFIDMVPLEITGWPQLHHLPASNCNVIGLWVYTAVPGRFLYPSQTFVIYTVYRKVPGWMLDYPQTK